MLIFNILLTTLIFIFTPLACIGFYKRDRQYRAGIEEKKAQAQASCEKLQRERSLIRQADSRLGAETTKIAELYRITRDMSAVLTTKEIFDILGNQLNKNFDFKRCRLILIDEEKGPFEIEKVFELKYQQAHSQPIAIETQDSELLKYSLESEKIGYIEQESFALLPLFFESKFTGVLIVEGLSANLLEGLSILANQFLLEFKRIKLYQKIQLMAITDGLTQLAARRYFLERLQEEIERSRRHNLKTALLMLDIDHFKQCNDHFGHLTGDVVLKEVAKRAKDCVREIDLVGRYGGEEFVLLLPDTDKASAQQAAERIRRSVDEHKVRAYDEAVKVEVSIGVATFPADSTAPEQLIDKADQALYRAKEQGRNKVCVY